MFGREGQPVLSAWPSVLVGIGAIAMGAWLWRLYSEPPGVGGIRGYQRWWQTRFSGGFLIFCGVGGLIAGVWRGLGG